MRTMYDALPGAFHGIPADAEMVAGYIDGGPGFPVMTDELWALYPHAVHVRIATQAGTNDGHVLDVESGDATPAQAPGWVQMRRAAGEHPAVYCSASAWGDVKEQFAAQGVAEPEWWIASYQQPPDTSIPEGAVAHQWGGNEDGGFDVSSVHDFWPGIDPVPLPTGDDMEPVLVKDPNLAGAVAYVLWFQPVVGKGVKRSVDGVEAFRGLLGAEVFDQMIRVDKSGQPFPVAQATIDLFPDAPQA